MRAVPSFCLRFVACSRCGRVPFSFRLRLNPVTTFLPCSTVRIPTFLTRSRGTACETGRASDGKTRSLSLSATRGVATSKGDGRAECQRAEGECVWALNQRARWTKRERDDPTHLRSTAATAATKLPCGFWSAIHAKRHCFLHQASETAPPSKQLREFLRATGGPLPETRTHTAALLPRLPRCCADVWGHLSLSLSPSRALCLSLLPRVWHRSRLFLISPCADLRHRLHVCVCVCEPGGMVLTVADLDDDVLTLTVRKADVGDLLPLALSCKRLHKG